MFSEKGHGAHRHTDAKMTRATPHPVHQGHIADRGYCGWAAVGSIHLLVMTNACS